MEELKRDAKRRRIRTRVQTFVSACATLLVIVPAVMQVLGQVVDAKTYAVLAGAAAVVTSFATAVVRIMTAPKVDAFINRHIPWLAADEQHSSLS